MSSQKYRYGYRPGKHRSRKLFLIVAATFVVLGIVGTIILLDLKRHKAPKVEGASRTVSQVINGVSQQRTIDEKTFIMELPVDWKEVARRKNSRENLITWQSTKKGEENRKLTLHIDAIPSDYAINRLLPIVSQGAKLVYSDLSDNCATFTGGGTFNTSQAVTLKPTVAKWQKVDFICNLPQVTDNQIGTGSSEGINFVSVTGENQGSHRYFFVYADRNIQPNYNILYDALRSFRAK